MHGSQFNVGPEEMSLLKNTSVYNEDRFFYELKMRWGGEGEEGSL